MPAKPKSPQVARGVRNHNPGNLRRSKDPWQGLADAQTDTEFFVFREAKWGIRALAKTLITYQDRYKLNTIRLIIGRWAPPNENDTGAYISSVADKTMIGPDTVIDVQDPITIRALVEAIIAHECSNYRYSDQVMTAGLVLAGIEPERKPISKTRTVQAQKVTISAGVASGGLATVSAIGPAVPVLRDIADFVREYPLELMIGFALVVMAAAAWTVWARIDDRNKGLR